MSFETVKYELLENVAIITFNRPDALNALSLQLTKDLGLPDFDPKHDRIMICGSPGLNKDMRAILDAKGFREGYTTTPGDYVVERAFVDA